MKNMFNGIRCGILCAAGAAALLLAFSSSLMAIGIGAYGGSGVALQRWGGKSGNVVNAGGGVVIDTAVASDRLFNYRFTLGFDQDYSFRHVEKPVPFRYLAMSMDMGGSTMNMYQTSSAYYKSKQTIKPISLNISHAFGFGVLRTNVVRLWLGPELVMSGQMYGAKGLWGVHGGLGLIVGVNVNLGGLVTLSFTGSGRAEYSYCFSKYSKYNINYMTMEVIPPPSEPLPSIPMISSPVTSESKSVKNKGFRFGGQFNMAVLFRVNDNYGM